MNRAVSGDVEPGLEAEPWALAFAAFARAATRRYVAPPLILSLAVGAALTASLLPLAGRLTGSAAATLDLLIERFLGNGFSRAIVFLFLASAAYGVFQLVGIAVDRERLRLLGRAGAETRVSWLACLAGRPMRPYTGDPALWTDGVSGDPHDVADRYSVQRHRHAELGLLPLRFSVWVLPLLGFIGTVVGIARSITGLEAVIAPGAGGQSAEGLLAVLGGLQFAFDTTLLGLVSVIPVMLLQMVLGGREQALAAEGHHCVLVLLAAGSASAPHEQGEEPASPPSSGAPE